MLTALRREGEKDAQEERITTCEHSCNSTGSQLRPKNPKIKETEALLGKINTYTIVSEWEQEEKLKMLKV